ncbi:dihydrolipoyl dehydrogenase family protein [Tropicimonas sp. S265A]|uniref:dihydrolipoyl dehydrogenase family protein n=1 Tax=Tropicimonas sp. S265A TaxID=3415134 RepID=UPI003C7D8527
MTNRIETDICVIGAGSGGLSVAAGAVQMGARVVLLEGHKMGGDCLNYGCVPSKALIAAAKQAHTVRKGGFGIAPAEPVIDYAAAKDHVHDVIATIEPVDSQERFEGLGVHVIREFGEFVSPTEVKAGDTTITARRFVIATGSRPFVPPIPGIDSVPYLTNESLFDLRDRPDHLIVIGGGPIGMEMAQAHVRLGSKVTVLEGAQALGKDDPELAAIALERLRGEGIEIVEGAQVSEVSGTAGDITVKTEDGRSFAGSHLLMAVGRAVNVDKLNLEAAGVDYDRRGVKVDASLRTTNKKVYAAGDVAGGLQFTHVAGYHAGVLIRQLVLGLPAKARTEHIPWATYTDPEIAQVGLTEDQARKAHGPKLEVARFAFDENDRAIASGRTTGLIKVMIVKGKPIGASIVGADAGELIGLWAYAIANGHKISAVANMVAPYPTLGEVNKRAAGAYFSPRLFQSDLVKRIVRIVQKF